MSVKAGDVVRVSFTNKSNNQSSTVVGVVEAVDAAHGVATVFVGSKPSWRVPTTSVAPVALPRSFSWTADDTEKVRSTTAAFATAASPTSPSPPPPPKQPTASPPPKSPQPDLRKPQTTASQGREDVPHVPANPPTVSSSSFRNHESYSFEPNASYTNILFELNARLTGLCTWSSPPLTVLFLSVLYSWLAIEGSGVLSWSRGAALLSAASVAQRCAFAVARTLVAVVLCTCVSMAPRVAAASTFWLLFPLMVVSVGGVAPVRWWNTLVVLCLPVRLPSQDGVGSAQPAAAAPLFLWAGKLGLDGVRWPLRGLSKAMIAIGESLRAVSEEKQ